MKILYVMGRGSTHNDIELRWSLRSLEKFALGSDGKVNVDPCIVGYAPKWFKGAVLPFEDEVGGRKQWNMANKLFYACSTGFVSGEFMMSADDHFLTRVRDFETAPQYYRGEMLKPIDERSKGHNFAVSLGLARQVLLDNGMPAMDFSQHFNTYFNAGDWELVHRLMQKASLLPNSECGANVHSLFANAWLLRNCGKRKLVWKMDRKYPSDTTELLDKGFSDGLAGFSISDDAFKVSGFYDWMCEKYQKPSRWEK